MPILTGCDSGDDRGMISIRFLKVAHALDTVTLSLPLFDTGDAALQPDHTPFSRSLCNRVVLDAVSFPPRLSHFHMRFIALCSDYDDSQPFKHRMALDWNTIAYTIGQQQSIRSVRIQIGSDCNIGRGPLWSMDLLRLVTPHFSSFCVHYCESMQSRSHLWHLVITGITGIDTTIYLYRTVHDSTEFFRLV